VVVTDTEQASVTLDVLADGSYDGVILTTTSRRSTLPRDLTERAIPHVLVNRVLDEPESHSCTVDNTAGTTAVADLLAALGHRHVGAIHGPVETSTGRERADALQTALRQRGIGLRRASTVRARFGHDAGLEAARGLLQQSRRPTAIVCGNDVIALGALSAACTLGLSVPGDLTIIGFDDIPMAGWPLISLTTVRCDLDALALSAVQMLNDEIEHPGTPPRLTRIPVDLVLRSTHAAPHRGADRAEGVRTGD
jgi:LacI family transcriptional regulator